MPIGPLAGMAIAQGASALAGGLRGATAKSGKMRQFPTVTPEQANTMGWARNFGQQQIQNPYAGFDPIAKRATSMFQQQTLPTLAQRFTGMGENALSSPSYQHQMSGANEDFQERLAALMANYGLHQQSLGQGLMGMGLYPEFENMYQPPQDTWLSSMFGGLSGAAGASSGMDLATLMNNQQGNTSNPGRSWLDNLWRSMRGR
jgi:hypothetical protein